jgi:predicted HAD superfamily phosphohydrolase YqeG
LLRPFHRRQDQASIVVRFGEIGLEHRGVIVMGDRLSTQLHGGKRIAEVVVCVGEFRIDRQSPLEGRRGLLGPR